MFFKTLKCVIKHESEEDPQRLKMKQNHGPTAKMSPAARSWPDGSCRLAPCSLQIQLL